MKNKILTCIFAAGLVLGLAACGGKGGNANEDKVLEDTENAAWVIHGEIQLADGTDNGWNGKDNALYEKSKMTAISIKEAKELDADVGAKLAAKKVKYLYKYEGAKIGAKETATKWTSKFLDAEKNLFQADGSFVFKASKVSYDAEEEVYAEQAWIPDPKLSYAESLNGNMFIPTWTEAFDEDGFSWAQNPVVRSGAGVYTIIVAQYENAPAYPDSPNYGIAVIKTGNVEGGLEYTALTKFVPGDHTYGVIGVNGDWDHDVALTGTGNGPYTADLNVTSACSIKVRADGKWDNNWGWANVDVEASVKDNKIANGADGNIDIVVGQYTLTLTFSGVNAKIVIAAKTV